MYCKLLSLSSKKFLEYQKTIKKIIGKKLTEQDISQIIQIYQSRLTQPNFNEEHFFLNLKGYLKYLGIEKRNNKYCADSITKNYFAPLQPCDMERFREDYVSVAQRQERGYYKVAYLAKSKIFRFYYLYPSKFFYSKLLGVSEVDIVEAVDNNLLTVAGINIAGKPIDVLERVLPLTEIFEWLSENYYDEIINKIKAIEKSNPIITDFIEHSDDNVGLAVRLDRQGRKRVYVVAFDLDLKNARHATQASDTDLLLLVSQQNFAKFEPLSLDYNYLVRFIPQLSYLSVQTNLHNF